MDLRNQATELILDTFDHNNPRFPFTRIKGFPNILSLFNLRSLTNRPFLAKSDILIVFYHVIP